MTARMNDCPGEQVETHGRDGGRHRVIPVAEPVLNGNERKYVLDCLDNSWISSSGGYVTRFEHAFAEFCGSRYAIACCSGTTALHLALLTLGVGAGDEVIVPTLTFVATANAVAHCGATPVFVDSEPETWNIDPRLIERAVSRRTKAIIAVHLFGHPADMDALLAVAEACGARVVEDAAEAHGAEYKGRRVGSIGDVGTFSFYGNKILTTGEGGMVVTHEADCAARLALLRSHFQEPGGRRYWHPEVGYSYQMTNLQAAIGLAQVERADWHLERRREIARWYGELLAGVPGIQWQQKKAWARSVYWMNSVVLEWGTRDDRDRLIAALARRCIEVRPFFYPFHTLPMYAAVANGADYPVASRLSARGINLPSSAALTYEDVQYVCATLRSVLETRSAAG